MGWLVARTDMPLRRTVRALVTASLRDAAVSRRHRLGAAGGAQQRPAQPGLPRRHRAPSQDEYLFNIYSLPGPDLRHLLLHVSLRVRAGRQCARPHSGRSRGRLLDPRRQRLDDGAARHDAAGHAGAAGRRAGRVPAGDDAVRLARDPGAAGGLSHHDHQDLEPVPVSAEAGARRGGVAAAADADGAAAARGAFRFSAGAAIRSSADGRAIRAWSRSAAGNGSRSAPPSSCCSIRCSCPMARCSTRRSRAWRRSS